MLLAFICQGWASWSRHKPATLTLHTVHLKASWKCSPIGKATVVVQGPILFCAPQFQPKCLLRVIYWSLIIRQEICVLDETVSPERELPPLRLSEEVASRHFHYTRLCFLQSTEQGQNRREPGPEGGKVRGVDRKWEKKRKWLLISFSSSKNINANIHIYYNMCICSIQIAT